MIIAFYKPVGIVSQFQTNGSTNGTLAEFGFPKGVYPVGRLDADSEGLLLLSDEKNLVNYLLEPTFAHPREYWAQVEGIAEEEALERLKMGVRIENYITKPCAARTINDKSVRHLPERNPPIRFRKNVPTSWISLELSEGKNRQVRKMTASVGLPTLRLVRVRIGALGLPFEESGAWKELSPEERELVLRR